jgi:hypothetical protein
MNEPKIGIFWLQYCDGEFSIYHKISYPVERGSNYGDFIVADEPHFETWEALKKDGVVPRHSEYIDLLRGRVLYNKVLKRCKVFTGKWVIPPIKKVIADEFDLPKRGVIWDVDRHYNNFKKLKL